MRKNKAPAAPSSHFIRDIADADLASGKCDSRTWGGKPGAAKTHTGAPQDPANIRTRFPPVPNGYLHFGHAKCLNFGLAHAYDGAFHMRFDNTNPEKEEQNYVDSIIHAVQWLDFDWSEKIFFASNYFDFMYEAAQYLIANRKFKRPFSLSASGFCRSTGICGRTRATPRMTARANG